MKALVFPGQGAQFPGMGKEDYGQNAVAKDIYEKANDILGYRITDVMFDGSKEDLKQTKITQPAIFLQSIVKLKSTEESINPSAVAGHSLGEFTALVANGCLDWKDGLRLVRNRALAMQKACETQKGTMAAVLGLDDEVVFEVCAEIKEIVVAANYNCPGQIVISGSEEGIAKASTILSEKGARRVLPLPVGGAFHSPLMSPAQDELSEVIKETEFLIPTCPIYQNVNGLPTSDAVKIKENLNLQLTSSVMWTKTMKNMVADGITSFIEVGGTGKVLSGMFKKLDRSLEVQSL